jgi:hypothetical protein
MVSDIVLLKELPDFIKESVDSYVSCISGALLKQEYIAAIKNAGFQDVEIIDETPFPADYLNLDSLVDQIDTYITVSTKDLQDIANSIVSVKVSGSKSNQKYS